jgi:hypothetical protein
MKEQRRVEEEEGEEEGELKSIFVWALLLCSFIFLGTVSH